MDSSVGVRAGVSFEVTLVVCYLAWPGLASPRAERISGQVFIVWGKQVRVIGRPRVDAASFESDEAWSVDGLHEKLGPHFEKLQPVTDGYSVPAA